MFREVRDRLPAEGPHARLRRAPPVRYGFGFRAYGFWCIVQGLGFQGSSERSNRKKSLVPQSNPHERPLVPQSNTSQHKSVAECFARSATVFPQKAPTPASAVLPLVCAF